MGFFDKKTRNTTNVYETNRQQTTTDNRIGGDGSIFGGNVSFGDNASGVEVVTTDYGAVDRAFDAFDSVIRSSDESEQRTLSAITKNTDNTVAALKDFAEKLTVGDIESAKWISFAIIAAVMIVLIVFFWKS